MDETVTPNLGSPVLRRTAIRNDAWWMQPLTVVGVLGSFALYSIWAAWQNAHFEVGPYLSPFYSPHIPESFLASIGLPRGGIFRNLFSPAFFVLWMPLAFRLTCYYYRKAYYRSFFADPPACAVREPGFRAKRKYTGETKFPFILQNVHRYFFYLAVLVVAFLWYDTVRAFIWPDGFGIGVGTLVLLLNVVLLSAYTFSCHSARHIVGGHVECFSCDNFGEAKYKGWRLVSSLNQNHMLWAWVSMFSVGVADVYIRLVSLGIITDVRLF